MIGRKHNVATFRFAGTACCVVRNDSKHGACGSRFNSGVSKEQSGPGSPHQLGFSPGQGLGRWRASHLPRYTICSPPVGDLRWRAPQPPASWSGFLDATGPAKTPCPQTGQYASTNEDCLYLNVFAPVRKANNKLPVMVWVHPGGQTSSAANDYDPARLTLHPVMRSSRPLVILPWGATIEPGLAMCIWPIKSAH